MERSCQHSKDNQGKAGFSLKRPRLVRPDNNLIVGNRETEYGRGTDDGHRKRVSRRGGGTGR
jgi:hypothetical protein